MDSQVFCQLNLQVLQAPQQLKGVLAGQSAAHIFTQDTFYSIPFIVFMTLAIGPGLITFKCFAPVFLFYPCILLTLLHTAYAAAQTSSFGFWKLPES